MRVEHKCQPNLAFIWYQNMLDEQKPPSKSVHWFYKISCGTEMQVQSAHFIMAVLWH